MNDVTKPTAYQEEVAKYTKKDAIIVICYAIYWVIMGHIGSIHANNIGGWSFFQALFAVSVVHTLPCIIIVLVRKQGLRSLGFRKDNLGRNLLFGVFVGVVPFLVYVFIVRFVVGLSFLPLNVIVFPIILTIAYAVREDILYVGFIQTRIYGLIKNDRWAVFAGAAFFSVSHWGNFFFQDVRPDFLYMAVMTVLWFLGHVYLMNAVYRLCLSIFPVFMLHAFFNFGSFAAFDLVDGYVPLWPFIVQIVLTAAAIEIASRYLNRRNTQTK
jgi:hypothetical protein